MSALFFFFKSLVIWVLAGAIARLLAGAGIALVTYSVLDDQVNGFLNYVRGFLSALPASVLDIMAMMGLGDALSIVGSALMTVAAIKAASMFLGVRLS